MLVAAIRASHLRWDRPPIFADDYALQMTTPFWRLVATNRLLNRLIVHRLLKVFRPIHTENILRIRYAEDRLREAVGAGVGQYVILGAGTRHLRAAPGRTRRPIAHLRGGPPRIAGDETRTAPRHQRQRSRQPGAGTRGLRERPARREADGSRLRPRRPGVLLMAGDHLLPDQGGDPGHPRAGLRRDRLRQQDRPRLQVPAPPHSGTEPVVRRQGGSVRGQARRADAVHVRPRGTDRRAGARRFAQLDNVPPDEPAQRYLQGRSDMPTPAANFAFALFGRE